MGAGEIKANAENKYKSKDNMKFESQISVFSLLFCTSILSSWQFIAKPIN